MQSFRKTDVAVPPCLCRLVLRRLAFRVSRVWFFARRGRLHGEPVVFALTGGQQS